MCHVFDINIAEKYGVAEAILLNNFAYWYLENKANNRNFFDDHYWSYNSTKAFLEMFPYFTGRQISSTLKNLIDKGFLITGNYNKSAYDRTLWYALTGKGISIIQKSENAYLDSPNDSFEKKELVKNTDENNLDLPHETQEKVVIKNKNIVVNKDTYGEFKCVKLSDDEYSKLAERLGKSSAEDYITRLDGWLAEGHKKTNHYATILNWWRKDNPAKKLKNLNSRKSSQTKRGKYGNECIYKFL